ncbi:SDR family NAD(P)-dependent oxidoreductase [uncultured Demequina sp.]|uniref:SDR family NAD(P)-dependent oxidoreductase n=1 Tax=uncultured Demequina sp. TaxID=693499 RepID=UPI0025EB2BCD|nr:SDR family NAD(P)-dependent oxidoreductase [uncultured Demequina sp.]
MARIFITGSSQGIGAECARQLLDLGHEVVLHARDQSRVDATLQANPTATAVVTGDLASLEDTRALASAANEQGPYDVIIHNAGVGGGTPAAVMTADGLERLFQINVAGPYVLTALMPPAPRMIYLTSGLEADGAWTPEDLQWTSREWNGMQAYSDSKLHDSMLAFELAARHPEAIVSAVDPGWIKTQLGGPDAWDPVELGAETQVWLATSDDPVATTSGQYVKRREVHEPNPIVKDADARAELVAALERATGVALP